MKKIQQRRTKNEILEDILNYLESVDRLVTLNDIAISNSTNTKVIQRWISLLIKFQNTGFISLNDFKGRKINLIRYSIFGRIFKFSIVSNKNYDLIDSNLLKWSIDQESNISNAKWQTTSNSNPPDIQILDYNDLSLESINFANKTKIPIICTNELHKPEITGEGATYFVYGYREYLDHNRIFSIPTEMPSIQLLKEISSIIIGPSKSILKNYIIQLIPIIVPQIGQISNLGKEADKNLSEIINFAQDIAVIILDNQLNRSISKNSINIWLNLDSQSINKLLTTTYGRLMLSKINYFTDNYAYDIGELNKNENLDEYYIWELARLWYKRELDESKFNNLITSYSEQSYVGYIIFKYLIFEENIEEEFIYNSELTPWYNAILSLIPPISRIKNHFNYHDFGYLYSSYFYLDEQKFPFIRGHILRSIYSTIENFYTKISLNYLIFLESVFNTNVNLMIPILRNLFEYNLLNENFYEIKAMVDYLKVNSIQIEVILNKIDLKIIYPYIGKFNDLLLIDLRKITENKRYFGLITNYNKLVNGIFKLPLKEKEIISSNTITSPFFKFRPLKNTIDAVLITFSKINENSIYLKNELSSLLTTNFVEIKNKFDGANFNIDDYHSLIKKNSNKLFKFMMIGRLYLINPDIAPFENEIKERINFVLNRDRSLLNGLERLYYCISLQIILLLSDEFQIHYKKQYKIKRIMSEIYQEVKELTYFDENYIIKIYFKLLTNYKGKLPNDEQIRDGLEVYSNLNLRTFHLIQFLIMRKYFVMEYKNNL